MKTVKLLIRIPVGILIGLIMLVGGYTALPIGFMMTIMGLYSWIAYWLKPNLTDYEKREKDECFSMIYEWPVMSYRTMIRFITTGEIPD